jgi:hypothetical protein
MKAFSEQPLRAADADVSPDLDQRQPAAVVC